MANNPEQLNGGNERGLESIGNDAAERSKELAKQLERSGEKGGENNVERADKARSDAKEALMSREAGGAERKQGGEPTAAPKRKSVGKKEREASFNRTMKHVQDDMNPRERAFSKFIHAPAVEKTSDAIGSTIARPNAILAGSVSALIIVIAVYVFAKNMGFTLSGFEMIGAFAIGWLIGLLFDFFRVMITGKK